MHTPVLRKELLSYLNPQDQKKTIDATLGAGGHAEAFLKKGVKLLGIELDPELLQKTRERLSDYENKRLVQGNFQNIRRIARSTGFDLSSSIYFDLGTCLWHYKKSGRGFSFHNNERLNMRFDARRDKLTASDVVNEWSQERIESILREYGEEKYAASIAKAILEARKKEAILTTRSLVEVINKATPDSYDSGRVHPARRTFQALRITVNEELDSLKKGLKGAGLILKKGGRIAVISFHSLEDRIVKNFFKKNPRLEAVAFNPITPTEQELKNNPSSRSSKLRVAEKIYGQ